MKVLRAHGPRGQATAAMAVLLGLAALVACAGDEEAVPAASPAAASPAATQPAGSTTATPTAAPVPDDWLTYVDPELGFSFAHPPGLSFTDSGVVRGERDIVFRSPTDASRPGLTIAIVQNGSGLSLEQWVADYTACLPETVQRRTISSTTAVFCTSQPEEMLESAVVFEHMGAIFFITSIMPPSEFDMVIWTLRL